MTRNVAFGNDQVKFTELGGFPVKACKYPDFFTGCLPYPQKGNPVSIALGGLAPVRTDKFDIPIDMIKEKDGVKYRYTKNGQVATGPDVMGLDPNQDGRLSKTGEPKPSFVGDQKVNPANL